MQLDRKRLKQFTLVTELGCYNIKPYIIWPSFSVVQTDHQYAKTLSLQQKCRRQNRQDDNIQEAESGSILLQISARRELYFIVCICIFVLAFFFRLEFFLRHLTFFTAPWNDFSWPTPPWINIKDCGRQAREPLEKLFQCDTRGTTDSVW